MNDHKVQRWQETAAPGTEATKITTRRYYVNEIFYSLQGEGVRAGTANFFVRLTGCNLACDIEAGPKSPGGFKCDTEFSSGRKMTAEEILSYCLELQPACRNVIFTGGEPLLQLDLPLLRTFKKLGFFACVETNGTIDPMPLLSADNGIRYIDWVTCSPKIAEHALLCHGADEVKYVRHHGQAVPRPRCKATHYLISPAFEDGLTVDPKTLKWCIQLCKDNPTWRLSVQQHKHWKVR